MLTFYIISAIVGGILILASAFASDDHHFHLGGGDSHDADGIHADVYIPFFSLRFWTYFFTFFGVTGLALTNFTTLAAGLVPWLSGATGLVAGLLVFFSMMALRKNEVDSNVSQEDLVGSEAKVLLSISEGKPGKIRCAIKGELLDLVAFTSEKSPIEVGARALVVGIENGNAEVVSLTAMLEQGGS
ncbi:MAG: hypothetical protein ACR2HJ_03050 [Fimbriimonadales bacterium]